VGAVSEQVEADQPPYIPNVSTTYLASRSNEIPQAANRVVGVLGIGLRSAGCVVGQELQIEGYRDRQSVWKKLSGGFGTWSPRRSDD
jgi:hypothetical protein